MRFVVTGAAGFIGSHLAETLLAAGHEVVSVDSYTDYYDPAVKERNASGLDVLRLDLARDELDFSGWDGVFHLAGQPGGVPLLAAAVVVLGVRVDAEDVVALLEQGLPEVRADEPRGSGDDVSHRSTIP